MRKTFLLTTSLFLFSCTVSAEPQQSLESIESLFKSFLDQQLARMHTDYRYQLSPLDSRLTLPACVQQPEVFSPRGTLKAGRNTIGLRCRTGKRWTIYSSVTIKLYHPVLVLTHPINRGEILTPQHFSWKKMELGLLHQGYVDNPDSILNQQAKRNLVRGTVLTTHHFEVPDLVKRGETVKIQAISSHFKISMNGIALMNGKKGQNIRVRNVRSKRIIQARVSQQGLVTIF
jgi:flagella basal body P-ring formation protein FlgA